MPRQNTKSIAVVGHGYVGKAVEHGFNTSHVDLHLIDPYLYGNSVGELQGKVRIDCAFVCVPTPFGADGSIDSSIVEEVVKELEYFSCMIVIKSTVTPDVIERLSKENDQIIYNPEFLTERNALEDFVNPSMHVFGGKPQYTEQLYKLYNHYSQCKPCPVFHMSAMEASFVKYGINSFLATKVLWFNQFKDIIDDHDCKYNVIVNAIGSDPRIGQSHTQVPGPDGRKGFGGACFPKDTNAFASFANGDFEILDEVIKLNNIYRKAYELDDREKEQKVNYG